MPRLTRGPAANHRVGAILATLLLASVSVTIAGSPALAASDYRLPWDSRQTWQITTGATQAHTPYPSFDFDIAANDNSPEVLAIADGSARITCSDSAGQAIVSLQTSQGDTFQYWHLDRSSVVAAGVGTSSAVVRQGKVLGRLHPAPPRSDRGCGYGTAAHLHLKLPYAGVTIDGRTYSGSGPAVGSQPPSSNCRGGCGSPRPRPRRHPPG